MGMLINGEWRIQAVNPKTSDGEFHRKPTTFRHLISNAEGSRFKPESGRYHLYVSLACPWAHRTLIFRQLKDLERHISISIVSPEMLDDGWEFSPYEGATEDHILDKRYLRDIYTAAEPNFTGRVTVPILWDKKENTVVNNESSEIIRMFNSQFNHITGNHWDFYPEGYRNEIDAINSLVYDKINNGVYKAGFASSQEAYDTHVRSLFSALDQVEAILERQAFLVGEGITEADWRLFVTLVRFDVAYVGHFKCNLKRLEDYPNLSNYTRALYQLSGIDQTVNLNHIKRHYYYSHKSINPSQVVPMGPEEGLDRPHNRPKVLLD